MARKKKFIKNKGVRNLFVVIIIASLITGVIIYGSNVGWFGAGEATATETTFKLISAVDGEDVSDHVRISVSVPEDDERLEDSAYFLSSNFEYEENAIVADRVSLDITEYSVHPFIYVIVDPEGDSVFETETHRIPTSRNTEYTIYVNHLSSDVYINIFDDELTAIAFTDNGTKWSDSSNFTVNLDFPDYTTTNAHVGSDWDVETADLDDYTEEQLNELYDERNYRNQAATYDYRNDTAQTYDDSITKLTSALVVKFAGNTTANSSNVNLTVSADYDTQILKYVDGNNIYLIFVYDIIFTFELEIVMVDTFGFTSVSTNRANIPGGITTITDLSAYTTISA